MCVPGCQELLHQNFSRRSLFAGAAAATAATALASLPSVALAQITVSKVVDLTHTMAPDFPNFFGVEPISFDPMFTFAKEGFNLKWWRVIEHAGTHIDPPLHFTADGRSVDAIPAAELVAPLCVVDVTAAAAADTDYRVTRADIEAWEAAHGRIPDGAVVAMNSGWAAYVGDAAKFTGKGAEGGYHFPGFSVEAVEFLLAERVVVAIAVDTMSLDHGPSEKFEVHGVWLNAGRYGLENVANLGELPPAGATIVVGAPKVKDGSGGITRVFALVA